MLLPSAFALLTSKTEAAYRELFVALSTTTLVPGGIDFSTKVITTDFETGFLPVLRQVFAEIIGCYFHYCKCLLTWVKQNGLWRRYVRVPLTRRFVRRFMALALLPLEVTEQFYRQLVADCPMSLRNFCAYWTFQWIEAVPPAEWNVFNHEKRTNNYSEGWNSKANRCAQSKHLNPWKLAIFIKDEEGEAAAKMVQTHQPGRMKRRLKKHEQVNLRIRSIVDNFMLIAQPSKDDVYKALDSLSTCILSMKSIYK